MDAIPEPPASSNAAIEEANLALKDAQWAEETGLLERAIEGYRKVVAAFPGIFEVHNNLANLLLALGQHPEALEAAQKALALNPDDSLVHANLGQAYLKLGRPEEAIPHLRKSLEQKPELHPLREMLADTLLEMGRSDEAIAVFNEVQRGFPNDLPLLKMMAKFYHRAQAGGPSELCFVRMLQLEPQRAATYNDFAQLYIDFAQYSKGQDIALKGLELEPDAPVLWNTLANCQASLGMVPEALHSYRKAIELAPGLAAAYSNMLLTMHYGSEIDPAELVEEHKLWGRKYAPLSMATTTFANRPDPARRIRIAYLSPDIRKHSVAFFLEPLLDHRDHAGFEVFCYADVKTPDEVTQRLKGKTDQYHSIVPLRDTQVVELIRNDQVDILIDLAGHAGSMRAAILGYKAAPVQVTYCGYPDSTGIEAVDYRITDWISDPAGVEDNYVEQLVRLPDGFLCFRPPEQLLDIGPPPALAGNGVTFGSFNREFKVSQKTYDLWCRILRAVPGSRMVMKSIAGSDPQTREQQLGEFERRGVARERVTLVGFIASAQQHLAGYREVDIALDTFPYHGTTTTVDSLLMGVPVITLSGYNHASRVGASLLTQVGIPEFIAYSEDDYVARAIELAGNLPRLRELHGTLRARLLSSTLCDGPGFIRKFEYTLRGMWCNWCRTQGASLSPEQAAMAAFDFTPLDALKSRQ